MGVQKKTRKFATVKRVIGQRDARLKKNQITGADEATDKKKKNNSDDVVRDMYVTPVTSPHYTRALCHIHDSRTLN